MHWASSSTRIMDLKVVSVSLLNLCVCFFLPSIADFYCSDRIGGGSQQPVARLHFLSFSHQKGAGINFLVPVLKFFEKKLYWPSLGVPMFGPVLGRVELDPTNLEISSMIPL